MFALMCIAAIAFVVVWLADESGSTRKCVKVISGVSVCVLVIAIFAFVAKSPRATIKDIDANTVAKMSDGRHVYYEEETDKYFVIKYNDWNPVEIYSKVYLNTNQVEHFLEVQEYLNSIDLFLTE